MLATASHPHPGILAPRVASQPAPRPLRICHVNTYDKSGGAARSAYRLHAGLQRIGHDSSMFVRFSTETDPAVTRFQPSPAPLDRLRRRWRRRILQRDLTKFCGLKPSSPEPIQDCRCEYGPEIIQQLPACDVAHLHWIAGSFVDYPSFFTALPKNRPLVWTLHDMNAFTGGCHYDQGCDRFVNGCGHCPQIAAPGANDFSSQIWQQKKRAFDALAPDQLHVVAPSHWLAAQARRSSLLSRFPVSVIPYGLDLHDFAPRDRNYARELIGLPPDARVLLFISDGVNNPRKGFALLAEALRGLEHVDNLVLLSLGRNKPALDVSVPWVHLDAIANDRFISAVYSAADLFAIPSLQDNLPNTVLEAFACGTPVVGFDVGGIPDMIRSGETGELVPARDVPALSAAIAGLLQNPARLREMSARCRSLAEQEYLLERQAHRYAELYQTLLRAA